MGLDVYSISDHYRICTSSTRPSGMDLYPGVMIYETDTQKNFVWDGTKWDWVGGLARTHTLDIQTGSTVFPVSGTSTGATVSETFARPFAEGPWIAGAVSTNTGTQGNLAVFAANAVTSTGFTARLIKVHTSLTFSSDIAVRWMAIGPAA